MSAKSRTPTLTPSPSRSLSPVPPIQPDHFYGSDGINLPPSPDSDGKTWLDPNDDPLAQRGIPVFKPTLEEFQDFEAYMNGVECWGLRSGIVKVIPPKEWSDALPAITDQLANVKLKNPIEQHMLGRGGLFRQQNMEKRRTMSVREWAELCSKDDFRAPGVDDVGLYHSHGQAATSKTKAKRGRRKVAEKAETAEAEVEADDVTIKEEPDQIADRVGLAPSEHSLASPPNSAAGPATPAADAHIDVHDDTVKKSPEAEPEIEAAAEQEDKVKSKGKRAAQTREAREANLAERAAQDAAFSESFDPRSDWLPPNTTPFDYTPEFCQKLERHYWRNCSLGKPAWYGADMAGSLFTEETQSWNVAQLPSLLTRLLPSSNKGLPGVNTPYLYFGMWRATFAWHVEDMDLFSINYIHFGAPKFWYAIPQARAVALEHTMRGYFPKDTSQCPQFLRHKSFLASPTLLSQSSCKPNTLVQHAGEFVITYPRGYHAGFNLGLNCAESVNFALDSWLELGRKAKICECISDSVRIDVDQLLLDRAAEQARISKPSSKVSRKRKSAGGEELPKAKKARAAKALPNAQPKASSSKVTVTLKLGPKPKEAVSFPCCLCVWMSTEGLLRVHDPPVGRKDSEEEVDDKEWRAHEHCANVVPETWVDEIEVEAGDGTKVKERVVFGVDGIVKDRWNLKCSACSKTRHKAHGAPIQCTKGKCPKAFHVTCARAGADAGILYTVLREVEKEVVLIDPAAAVTQKASKASALETVRANNVTDAMEVDVHNVPQMNGSTITGPVSDTAPRVLKVIRKVEVEVLCPQHNPAVAEAKKASKLDKIRRDLLALPHMSRIKIRVSAGVFEVSLLRVNEETKSVEVLWDRGLRREFKWGSVVFGHVEGQTVGQKPSEPAPEAEALSAASQRVLTFPSVSKAAATLGARDTATPQSSTPTPGPSSVPPQAGQMPNQYLPYQQHHTAPYNYWAYQYPPTPSSQPQQSYNHSSYYSSAQGYNPYPYSNYQHPSYQSPSTGHAYPSGQHQGYDQHAYSVPLNHQHQRPQQLQWKQPYVGPSYSTTGTPTPSYSSPMPPRAMPSSASPAPGVLTQPMGSLTQSQSQPPAAVPQPQSTAEQQIATSTPAADKDRFLPKSLTASSSTSRSRVDSLLHAPASASAQAAPIPMQTEGQA